jgi:hypothetical protein
MCGCAIDAKQIDGRWIVHLVGGKVTELNYLIGQKKWNRGRGNSVYFHG